MNQWCTEGQRNMGEHWSQWNIGLVEHRGQWNYWGQGSIGVMDYGASGALRPMEYGASGALGLMGSMPILIGEYGLVEHWGQFACCPICLLITLSAGMAAAWPPSALCHQWPRGAQSTAEVFGVGGRWGKAVIKGCWVWGMRSYWLCSNVFSLHFSPKTK